MTRVIEIRYGFRGVQDEIPHTDGLPVSVAVDLADNLNVLYGGMFTRFETREDEEQ